MREHNKTIQQMNVNQYSIVAFAPAMSDILLEISDDLYLYLKLKYFSKSNWAEIYSSGEFYSILSLLQIEEPECYIEAGSTILGTLSALPRWIRKRSCIITFEGTDNDYLSNISYGRFEYVANSIDISVKSFKTSGKNNIGLIVTSKSYSERLMFLRRDMPINAPLYIQIPSSNYLFISAYELIRDSGFYDCITSAINSDNRKLIIGLGNSSIITNTVINKIKKLCLDERISCLAGNCEEFNELYNKLNHEDSYENIIEKCKVVLITFGSLGMFMKIDKNTMFKSALSIDAPVSSNGCGDIALGCVIAGIIQKSSINTILCNAVYYSSKILNRKSNIFVEGIENVM